MGGENSLTTGHTALKNTSSWYVVVCYHIACFPLFVWLLLLIVVMSVAHTGVCLKKEKHFFYARLGMQPSGRNCNPAPDSVFPKLTFQPVFLSGGVFFSQTPVWEKFALPESILPACSVNLASCKTECGAFLHKSKSHCEYARIQEF